MGAGAPIDEGAPSAPPADPSLLFRNGKEKAREGREGAGEGRELWRACGATSRPDPVIL